MALTDIRGLAVSTDDRNALDRFEDALLLFNGFYADPLAAIDAALAERPDFVLGHCFRAGLFALSTEKAAEPELRRSVEAAEALWAEANERERGHIAAARAWLDGDFGRAAELYGRVAIEHPRDLMAIQFAHQCDFFLGWSVMLRDRVARASAEWDESVPGYGYVLGMHAFGLEEMGEYRRAEETGRRAVELNPRDAWAIHAVAHVMEMEGRTDAGVGWLMGRAGDWSPDNMLAVHNWWHLALHHLDRGETDRVREIYDAHIRPRPGAPALEILDASAMLWRLHLRDAAVGDRWAEVADAWEPMADHAYYAFNDMHAMMGFTATGRRAAGDRLLSAMTAQAGGAGSNAAMTRKVGLPVCRAIRAFGDGEHAEAVEMLMPLRPVLPRFGGSHAQRDVVALTLVEAALRSGQDRLARALAAERLAQKPDSPFNLGLADRAARLCGERTGAGSPGARRTSVAA